MRTRLFLAALCAGLGLAALLAAAAGTEGQPAPKFHFPLKMQVTPRVRPTDLPLRLEPYVPANPPRASAVDLGPFRAQTSGTGDKSGATRYRFDGLGVLGGSVVGTVDRGRAQLYLRWPPGDD